MHRRLLLIDIIAAIIVVGGIVGVAVLVLGRSKGPAPTPFPTAQIRQAAHPSPAATTGVAQLALGNWPTYGYDAARTRFNPAIGLRPPYRVKWRFRAHDLLEFPPSIFRDLYFSTEHGYVYCLDAATSTCAGASTCTPSRPRRRRSPARRSTPARSAAASWPSTAGPARLLWQISGLGAIESSPLVWHGRLFFGSHDDHIYAVGVRSHRIVWRYATGGPVKGSVAELDGHFVVGSYDGAVYCLAYDGSLLWRRATGGLLSSTSSTRPPPWPTTRPTWGAPAVASTPSIWATAACAGRLPPAVMSTPRRRSGATSSSRAATTTTSTP